MAEGVEKEIINRKYEPKGGVNEIPENVKKEMEKTKKKLDELKKYIIKKYPYTIALGILPPQYAKKYEEEEGMREEDKKKKLIHLAMIIPEEKEKEILKIKNELIKYVKEKKQNIWFHIESTTYLWEDCFDGKYELVEGIAMSFPLHDKGFLGALRVVSIHKSLVLRKFEKYVVSYVIAGSFLRGTATKTSDIDVFIIINDTDVKRMPRLELKEKLRAIIYSYVNEAMALAGVKNTLHIQTYLLTEFWDAVKDAHPVIFTFIRDGVAIYDQGTFTPWKLLLRMGKLKPSPEAIEMFMTSGEKTKDLVNRRLIDAMMDIYYGILTPSQALIMLYGMAPPTHKETPDLMKKIFVIEEKLLEKKYSDFLTKVVNMFKDYEHGKLKTITGKEIDQLKKDSDDYMKRLKELRVQIEKRSQEKIVEDTHKEVFDLLKNIFNNKGQDALIKEFEKQLVKKGKISGKSLTILKDIVDAKKKIKTKGKSKIKKNEVENIRKNGVLLINSLVEYSQRRDLMALQKNRMLIEYGKNKEKKVELLVTNSGAFLLDETSIKKIEKNKIKKSNRKELEQALKSIKAEKPTDLNPKIFDVLKKELGSFEIKL